ncbi:unnamed protein product [Zymoseptoria tritici ST99CH_1A5]|uniref:Uncharacterized protein n=2 Tax=Zymoseptoria tritici TaxID=1047171 RepID=A0A2H1GG00_ZYMTR|nr:unnamed protein product [Zymoseptoria tritici ST99CH_1E4]SMR53684.1 unnamed protein product [Zymoseptoria tritici ST99CH_3D1]SMY24309.1 unnamed protein product [Zymoseptoria tritici ST99CH_1A5]
MGSKIDALQDAVLLLHKTPAGRCCPVHMVVVSADGLLKLPLSHTAQARQRANAIDDVDQDVAEVLHAQMYKFRESLGVKKYAPMEAGKFAEFLATAAAEVRNDWSIANDPESLKLVKGAEFAAKMSPASFLRTYLRLAGTMSASTLSGNVRKANSPASPADGGRAAKSKRTTKHSSQRIVEDSSRSADF